jgi:4-hydroxy-tetrahydrodipicolinate synthase
MARMMEAALAGDLVLANEIHYRLFALMGAMFCYPSPAPAKKALELMGKIRSGEVRLPMTEMDEASIGVLKKAMAEVGLGS